MIMYDFHCHTCGNTFERLVKNADAGAEAQACPECNETNSFRMPSALFLGDPDRMFAAKKVPDGFKDVLRKIHEKSPGSRLKETSSIDFSSKQ